MYSPSARLHSTTVSQRGVVTYVWCTGFYVQYLSFSSSVLVFAASTQGTSLGQLALVTREAFLSGSHRTIKIRETVLGRLPPRTAQTAD